MNMYKAILAFVCLGTASMNFGYFGQKPVGGYFSNDYTDKIVVHVGPAGSYAAVAGVAQEAGKVVQVTNAARAVVVEKTGEPIKAMFEQAVESAKAVQEIAQPSIKVVDVVISKEVQASTTPQQSTTTAGIWNAITSFIAKHKIAVAGVVIAGVAGVALYKYYKAKQAQSAKDNDQK